MSFLFYELLYYVVSLNETQLRLGYRGQDARFEGIVGH